MARADAYRGQARCYMHTTSNASAGNSLIALPLNPFGPLCNTASPPVFVPDLLMDEGQRRKWVTLFEPYLVEKNTEMVRPADANTTVCCGDMMCRRSDPPSQGDPWLTLR